MVPQTSYGKMEMGEAELKGNRNLTLDFAKGAAILLMLLDHILGHGKIITSFHMPLFFIVSGYLLKEETWKNTLRKKAKGLLLPYVAFSMAALLSGFIKAKFYLQASWYATGNYMIHKLTDTLMGKDIWLLWFLLALFEAVIIYVGICKIVSHRLFRTEVLLLIFVAGYVLSQKYRGGNPYYIDQGMMAVLFIAVGNGARRFQKKKYNKGLMFALMLCLWIFGIHKGTLVMANRIYEGFPLCIMGAVAGSYIVIQCSHYLKGLPFLGKIIVWFGQNTLNVLCFANLFCQFCDWKKVCECLGIYNVALMFLLQAGIIAGCVMICKRFHNVWAVK